ncbi:MAG: hypothetical protein AAB267_05215, partial [Candidatus Desantisbacteria bacterium]
IDNSLREVLIRAIGYEPELRTALVNNPKVRAFREDELQAWLKRLDLGKPVNRANITGFSLFTIDDVGAGEIREKKTREMAYYNKNEVISIARNRLSIVDPYGVKHTFALIKDKVTGRYRLGKYIFRSEEERHASSEIENTQTGLMRHERGERVIFDLVGLDGKANKKIVHRIFEEEMPDIMTELEAQRGRPGTDIRLRDYWGPGDGRKVQYFIGTERDKKTNKVIPEDISKSDFAYFYIDGDADVRADLYVSDGKKGILFTNDRSRQNGKTILPFWTPFSQNDITKGTNIYAASAPFSVLKNARFISVAALKQAGIDITKVGNMSVSYWSHSNPKQKFQMSELYTLGDGSSIGGEISKKLYEVRDVFGDGESMVLGNGRADEQTSYVYLDDETLLMTDFDERTKDGTIQHHLRVFDTETTDEILRPLYTVDPYTGRLLTLDINNQGLVDEDKGLIGVSSLDLRRGVTALLGYKPKANDRGMGVISAYGTSKVNVEFPNSGTGWWNNFSNRVYGSVFGVIARRLFSHEDYRGKLEIQPMTARDAAVMLNARPSAGEPLLDNTDKKFPWEEWEWDSNKAARLLLDMSEPLFEGFLKGRTGKTGLVRTAVSTSYYKNMSDYVDTVKELEIIVPYLLSRGYVKEAQKILDFYINKARSGPLRSHYHITTGNPLEYNLMNKSVTIAKPTA